MGNAVSKIERYVHDMFSEMVLMSETQPPSEREFRTSGLPFCPILSFLKEDREESYASSFYTSIGTSIHLVMQTWLAKTKLSVKHVYGNWKCTGCGKEKRMCKQPSPCTCGSTHSRASKFHERMKPFWMYEEIEYNYRGLSGHIDLVYWPLPNFAFTLDFKTSDIEKKKKSGYWIRSKPSSPTYVVQVRTYNTVLDLHYGVPIRGWCLANLDRAQPIKKSSD